MQRFGEAASVGKAMGDQPERKAPVQPLKYALPAVGMGLGAHQAFRAAKPNTGGMQEKAIAGLKNADTGMTNSVARLNRAKREPTAMNMGRKAMVNPTARAGRVKAITHRQNLASAKRGVELSERNILTAAQRYQAVQRQLSTMMNTGTRLKRGALGAGLIGLGTLGAVAQRKKEKSNAQVW